MTYFALALSAVVAVLIVLLKQARQEAEREGTTTSKEFAGICAAATHRTLLKEKKKAKALQLLKEKGELSNSDIRHEINVSRNTVIRYMDELESEGKTKQIGEIGQSVVYRLFDN